jgi:hypothetical protein
MPGGHVPVRKPYVMEGGPHKLKRHGYKLQAQEFASPVLILSKAIPRTRLGGRQQVVAVASGALTSRVNLKVMVASLLCRNSSWTSVGVVRFPFATLCCESHSRGNHDLQRRGPLRDRLYDTGGLDALPHISIPLAVGFVPRPECGSSTLWSALPRLLLSRTLSTVMPLCKRLSCRHRPRTPVRTTRATL